jgi:hypothetical protein
MIYFTSYGPFLAENLLGVLTHSKTPVRYLCEWAIIETLGHIPSLQDFFQNTPIQPWMYNNASPLSSEFH